MDGGVCFLSHQRTFEIALAFSGRRALPAVKDGLARRFALRRGSFAPITEMRARPTMS